MARLVLRLVTAVILAGLLLVPALATMGGSSSTAVADPVTITSYRATYDVDEDGTLHASETITADFPWGRHGIFRYWDRSDQGDHTVRHHPKDVRIRLDELHEQLASGVVDAEEQVSYVDPDEAAAVKQAGVTLSALVATRDAVERARNTL